jgi:hypothetical protein
MSDNDQIWNAFVSALPAQDQARHDLQNFQSKLLKSALIEIELLNVELSNLRAQFVHLKDDWLAMAQEVQNGNND